MNLRTITIWTTGLMIIVTFVVPSFCVFVTEGARTNFSTITMSAITIFNILYGMTLLWWFSGSPMAVSFIIARKLKYDTPIFILFVSTIAYCFLFVYSQFQYLAATGGCMSALWLLTPFSSLFWLIPVWITAIMLNRRYAKKITASTEQTQSEDCGSDNLK